MYKILFAVVLYLPFFYSLSLQAKSIEVAVNNLACDDQRGQPFCHISPAIQSAKPNDVINVASGSYDETLVVDKDLQINGVSKNNTVVNANQKSRVLTINPGIHVKLASLTLQNGLADNGGGIFNQGSLELSHVRVLNNMATLSGGGIYNANSISGSLQITNSQISYNYSQGDDQGNIKYGGGGIFNNAPLTIANSELNNNHAVDNGGGVYTVFSGRKKFSDGEILAEKMGINLGLKRQRFLRRKKDMGAVSIKSSRISHNTAEAGGGINLHGVLELSSSILSFNAATNSARSAGGGLFAHFDTLLQMSNVLLNFNKATFRGGGLRFYSVSTGSLSNVSIIDNEILLSFGQGAGVFIIKGEKHFVLNNTLIARNYIRQQRPSKPMLNDCAGSYFTMGNNFLSSINHCPGFKALQDNYQKQLDLTSLYRWDRFSQQYTIPKESALRTYGRDENCTNEIGQQLNIDIYENSRLIEGKAHCDIGAIEYSTESASGSSQSM